MKRKITLLLLAAASVLSMNAQVALSQDFNSPNTFSGTGNDWWAQNLSSPTGSLSWFDGASSNINAYNGTTVNDLVGVNFASTGTVGTISNWLISPTVTIYNGAVFSFATVAAFNYLPTGVFPDRLQLRMSTAGTNSVITGGGPTDLGDFTNLLLDINPTYANTASGNVAQTGATVPSFPGNWNTYSVQISLPPGTGTVTGRFAFRYFVENGGSNGTRSDEIGIDAVRYTLPCGTVTAQSYTTCANTAVVLNAVGALPATTYTWSGASGVIGTSQTVSVVAPASGSSIFTVQTGVNGGSCGTTQTVMVTAGAPTMSLVSSASNTVCTGLPIVFVAAGPAASFGWVQNGNIITTGTSTPAPNITVLSYTPTQAGSITFSVGGLTGGLIPPNCAFGTSTVITVVGSPTLSYVTAPTVVCPGSTLSINTSGATSYTYDIGNGNTNNPLTVNISTTTAAGAYGIDVYGTAANGCISVRQATFAVGGSPTITAVADPTVACKNSTVEITASGAAADTYTFVSTGAGAVTSTVNPLAYSTGTAGAGVRTFTVSGLSTAGCKASAIYTLQVYTCTGIESVEGSGRASVFPNPFANELKVSGVSGTVKIYNALGQAVITTRVNEEETVNTSDLAKGVYILKAYDENGTLIKTVKMLKN